MQAEDLAGRSARTWMRRASLGLLALLVPLLLGGAPALALEPGDEAPLFSLPALDGGKPVSLAAHRGKLVWLDFWASWCPPCLSSLPQLEELRKQLPAKEFQIIAVNVDSEPKQALRFLERHPIGYPSASDPQGRLPEQYGLETMPTSYLIDRDGVIRHVHSGYRSGDIAGIKREIEKHLSVAAPRPR